jgi:hypothetical protein
MTKREEWEFIQAEHPDFAEALLEMQKAGMKPQGIEWIEGGPWAEAA